MKDNVFDFKSKETDLKAKVINKKKLTIVIIIAIFVVSVISLLIVYSVNEEFRNFWDYSVLRKEVESSEVLSIPLERDILKYTYSYGKRLVVLEKNLLEIYNKDGNKEIELSVQIANPIFEDNNRFLVIGENNGKKLCLLNDTNIVWQKDLEGDISQVYVNKNGYVGVAMSATGYKTIIILYNPSGEELFRTYLPTTYCIDMEISNDNKYMAVAELNSSGTMLETSIKIISVENAKTKPQEAFIATYNPNSTNMILNLKYIDDGKLVVMYDNQVMYANEKMENILNISEKAMFVDIESSNKIIVIEKQNAGLLNTNYTLKIVNTDTTKVLEYSLKDLPKELYVKENIIAINYGTDVEIISAQSGWLIKRYVSRQDIKKVLISNGFVTIEYNDEMKIIKI